MFLSCFVFSGRTKTAGPPETKNVKENWVMDSDSGLGGLIVLLLAIAAIAFVVYCVVMLASAIVAVAGVGGLAWGGGTALLNYGKSFKENMIDSNRKAA